MSDARYAALAERCERLREALETVWAAIGDALCSGSGIEKAYAHAVQRDVQAALADMPVDALRAGRPGTPERTM